MSLHLLPIGSKAPDIINVVIEIPAGSRNKYEYDEELQVVKLDRVMTSSMSHPYDYGFVPETRSDDGDHIDALVLMDYSVFPGCLVQARPIGVMKMTDDGEGDEKIVCVPADDVKYKDVHEISDLSPHLPKRIQHFFEHYKDLENKQTIINGWGDAAEAKQVIERGVADFKA